MKNLKTFIKKYIPAIMTGILTLILIVITYFQYQTTEKQTKIAYLNHLSVNEKYQKIINKYYLEGLEPFEVYEKVNKSFKARGIDSSIVEKPGIFQLKCADIESEYLFLGIYDSIKKSWDSEALADVKDLKHLDDIKKLKKLRIDKLSAIRKGFPIKESQNYEYCIFKRFSNNEVINLPQNIVIQPIRRGDFQFDVWLKI